jgi:deoxyadenosine/deoxycytidine kinase
MAKYFVLVAGNIGTGKTSLTERLGKELGWFTAYESVEDNPYLADFYADMAAWSFHLNVFFLGDRAEQHIALARTPLPVLMDRIEARGREMERGITQEYMRLLEDLYDEWMERFDTCPVLTIRTDDLDFVHQPKHLDTIISRIYDKLAGKEEIAFLDV